jgi:sigma-54 specific flagellar transcriptional regulator A
MPIKIISELVIGESEAIASVRTMIRYSINAKASVMITGASGSGKEVVAQAIHRASRRRDEPFIAVNSGAISPELIESELFGHEGGSFTGATGRHIGLFEQANGGTLFLDEIGEMPLALQVKLLRVIEERSIRRVGGTKQIPVDVRIIAATNRDLHQEIATGGFREDLFYRLCVIPISLPALAARLEDVGPLVAHFIGLIDPGEERPVLNEAAIARLAAHDWPGNARELRNVVERAGIFFPGQTIGAEEVELLLTETSVVPMFLRTADRPEAKVANVEFAQGFSLQDHLQSEERRLLVEALVECGGVIAQAARLVDVQRTTFVEKMRRHNISRDERQAA